MDTLQITLFGRFGVRRNDALLDGFRSQKVQELFSYLLINRNRPHPREVLASVLWDHGSTEQSRMYLRRVLWRLQQTLQKHRQAGEPEVLLVEKEWVQLNPQANLWIDVAVFEAAYETVRGVPGRFTDHTKVNALRDAVKLYTSDLLENWYHDWCLFERERLQNVYLVLLDKLMDYCEAHQEYELGMHYASRILRIDRAREHTHRRLMRLLYQAGNRTGALRQYEVCAAILEEELGVKPSRTTRMLYEQICADEGAVSHSLASVRLLETQKPTDLSRRLHEIQHLQEMITSVQMQLQQEIKAIEHTMAVR